MSVEKAIISRSQPYVVTAAAMELLHKEASKGCRPDLSQYPVNMEPEYLPSINWMITDKNEYAQSVTETIKNMTIPEHLNCWMPPEHTLNWNKSERFIKELMGAHNRIRFEITGNEESINIGFFVNRDDNDILQVAFRGEYSDCEITTANENKIFEGELLFYDFFPKPPYHHLLTRPTELTTSPYDPFIIALARIPITAKGFVQVLFEPAKHNWHQNVKILTDLEFLGTTINDPRSAYRIKQQLPSGDIRNMAREVETKAHNDKPFYFVAIRSGIRIKEKNYDAWALSSFTNLFQHGGQPLQFLTEEDYKKQLTKLQIQEMFQFGSTYRPGFLLNSSELAGLVHLPTVTVFDERQIPLKYIEKLSITLKPGSTNTGIKIGYNSYAGEKKPVYINFELRKTSTHLIGRSGTGKSPELENLILQDIDHNCGIAFLDPHGDSIKRLLHLIPAEKIESTIYIDFGNSEWIPIWNPLKKNPGQSIGRTADDLVTAFKSVIKGNAWGDRLEHLLRNGLYGLLHLENSTFYDLLILFEQIKNQSTEKKYLIKEILNAVENEVAKRFWGKDVNGYRRDDFAPPHHKLSKLLNSDESVSLMLTQPDNLLKFMDIMDTAKILLLDLSNVGPDTRKILGSYLLSFLHNYSLGRSKIATGKRKPFNIYCDEAHKLTTDTLEDMITESRKFGISLTLAHQYLNQFNTSQRDALLSMGTTIIFNVDLADARYLVKDLQGKVEAKDIATLETGEAIARIGTEIVKIKTPAPKPIPDRSPKEEIIIKSRQKYYRRAVNVKKTIRERLRHLTPDNHLNTPFVLDDDLPTNDFQTFTYDEFE